MSEILRAIATQDGFSVGTTKNVRMHDLRHSAASEMINAGIDFDTVAGVLEHKTTTSSRRYAHLLTDRLAEAVKKIGRS
ncbi:tyrosine-type recombinase/integrase [Burkholderia stabilis]